ncbi:hypothetical protein T265_15727, partial [Opisthorchis viverrini]
QLQQIPITNQPGKLTFAGPPCAFTILIRLQSGPDEPKHPLSDGHHCGFDYDSTALMVDSLGRRGVHTPRKQILTFPSRNPG